MDENEVESFANKLNSLRSRFFEADSNVMLTDACRIYLYSLSHYNESSGVCTRTSALGATMQSERCHIPRHT